MRFNMEICDFIKTLEKRSNFPVYQKIKDEPAPRLGDLKKCVPESAHPYLEHLLLKKRRLDIAYLAAVASFYENDEEAYMLIMQHLGKIADIKEFYQRQKEVFENRIRNKKVHKPRFLAYALDNTLMLQGVPIPARRDDVSPSWDNAVRTLEDS